VGSPAKSRIKVTLPPSPLAGRPPLRRYRVHKKFESPAAEAIAYDTRYSGANLPLRRYKFRPSQGRAAVCCMRPGGPAICGLRADPSLPLRVSPADSHPSTRKTGAYRGPRLPLRSRPHNGSNTDPSPAQNAGSGLRLRARTPAKRLRLSKNAGSCCLGSRRPATTKHTVTILLCICQGEFTPKFPAETRVGLGLKPRYILNHLRHG
jgi:hypothetical protein